MRGVEAEAGGDGRRKCRNREGGVRRAWGPGELPRGKRVRRWR